MARGKPGETRSRSWIWLLAALCLFGMWQVLERERGPDLAFLPAEAHATLALIDRGGPFPHRQDGSVFQNRERLLPERPRGHYREYTVDTPGLDHRGARRIVTGGDPPAEWYYTADHYRSFRAFQRRDPP